MTEDHSTGHLRPVVVIDDSPEDLAFILQRLKSAGVRNPVLGCQGVAEAAARLTSLSSNATPGDWPFLFFLEMRMSVLSGVDFLRWLNTHARRNGLVVMMHSNSVSPAEIEMARALGADGFIIKQPSQECLAAIVETAMLHVRAMQR